MEGQTNFVLKRTHLNAFRLFSILRYCLIRFISYDNILLDALACGFTVRCAILSFEFEM